MTKGTLLVAAGRFEQNANVFVKSAVCGTDWFTMRLSGAAPKGGLAVAYFVVN